MKNLLPDHYKDGVDYAKRITIAPGQGTKVGRLPGPAGWRNCVCETGIVQKVCRALGVMARANTVLRVVERRAPELIGGNFLDLGPVYLAV